MRSFVLFGLLALAGLSLGQNPIEIFSAPLMPANHPGDIGMMQIEAIAPSASPGAAEFHRPGAQTIYVSQSPVSPSLATASAGADPAWGTGLATTRRPPQPFAAPRIYIEPQNGFEYYLAAAFGKKHVPAVVTQNIEEAQFVLTSVVLAKEESTGGKVVDCLFMYCLGMNGIQRVSVQLINADKQIAWAYQVRKPSADAYESTSEAVAKHLKDFLEKHPQ